jgi:hypothetical protein
MCVSVELHLLPAPSHPSSQFRVVDEQQKSRRRNRERTSNKHLCPHKTRRGTTKTTDNEGESTVASHLPPCLCNFLIGSRACAASQDWDDAPSMTKSVKLLRLPSLAAGKRKKGKSVNSKKHSSRGFKWWGKMCGVYIHSGLTCRDVLQAWGLVSGVKR